MVEDYPRTLVELMQRFTNDQECLEYLIKVKWPNGFICPICKGEKYWIASRNRVICSECKNHIYVTAGTILHGTHKPLYQWFQAIWHITNQKYGANALGLQRIIGFGSYVTAWTWLHKLRRAMVRPNRDNLNGTIEVDETYIGGIKSGKRGRGAAGKSLVLIAVEDKKTTFGRIRLQKISDASEKSLTNAIKKMIAPKSIIRTDAWNGYLNLEEQGYKHIVYKNESNVGNKLLPLAHRIASLLKRWLIGTYQGAVENKYLDYYLDEYTFRFNRRKSQYRGKLFYRLIQQIMQIGPISYNEIVDGNSSDSVSGIN